MAHGTAAGNAGMVFVTPMQIGDLPEVLRIDEASFPKPWPEAAWRHELLRNSAARCYVARPEPPRLNRWSALVRQLHILGVDVAVLESDVLRKSFSEQP